MEQFLARIHTANTHSTLSISDKPEVYRAIFAEVIIDLLKFKFCPIN